MPQSFINAKTSSLLQAHNESFETLLLLKACTSLCENRRTKLVSNRKHWVGCSNKKHWSMESPRRLNGYIALRLESKGSHSTAIQSTTDNCLCQEEGQCMAAINVATKIVGILMCCGRKSATTTSRTTPKASCWRQRSSLWHPRPSSFDMPGLHTRLHTLCPRPKISSMQSGLRAWW